MLLVICLKTNVMLLTWSYFSPNSIGIPCLIWCMELAIDLSLETTLGLFSQRLAMTF